VVVGAGATGTGAGGDSYFVNSTTIMAKGGGSVATDSLTGATGGQASAGTPGSPGYETTLYRALTGAAVAKFQQKYASEILTPIGLTAPTTKFGAMSRAKANALCVTAPAG
jgi:hypothetical protein